MAKSAATIRMGRAAERALEGLSVALKACDDRGRQIELDHRLFDGGDRFADRVARSEIEAQSHRRKLALMIDCERRDRWAQARELAERRHAAPRRFRIDAGERVGAELVAGVDFEDDVVLIECRIDLRDMSLTERVVEHSGRPVQESTPTREATSRSTLMLHRAAGALLIAGDIGKLRAIPAASPGGSAPSGRVRRWSMSTKVYWYWVFDSRAPTLMSCAACM